MSAYSFDPGHPPGSGDQSTGGWVGDAFNNAFDFVSNVLRNQTSYNVVGPGSGNPDALPDTPVNAEPESNNILTNQYSLLGINISGGWLIVGGIVAYYFFFGGKSQRGGF